MADVTPSAAPDIGRNIIQSHSERPIIKTAPDFIVFWENSPYIINQYVGDPFTVVNLNDFVISASGGADIDALIPSGSVSLSVPNHLKYLFFGLHGAHGFFLPRALFWGPSHNNNKPAMDLAGLLFLQASGRIR